MDVGAYGEYHLERYRRPRQNDMGASVVVRVLLATGSPHNDAAFY